MYLCVCERERARALVRLVTFPSNASLQVKDTFPLVEMDEKKVSGGDATINRDDAVLYSSTSWQVRVLVHVQNEHV